MDKRLALIVSVPDGEWIPQQRVGEIMAHIRRRVAWVEHMKALGSRAVLPRGDHLDHG